MTGNFCVKWVGNIHCNIVCGDENYREGVVDTQLTVQNEKRNKVADLCLRKFMIFHDTGRGPEQSVALKVAYFVLCNLTLNDIRHMIRT